MTSTLATHTCDARCQLERRASLLSYITVGYNIVEGIVTIWIGLMSNAVSLVGFGIDSFVESLSGSVMIWRFSGHNDEKNVKEEREALATKLVSGSLAVLGVYVLYESVGKLLSGEGNDRSLVGLSILIVSIIVMPALYFAKKKVATKLHSHSLEADSKQTLACMFISFVTLLGLGFDYFTRVQWIDPALGIAIASYLMYEAYRTHREKKLCAC